MSIVLFCEWELNICVSIGSFSTGVNISTLPKTFSYRKWNKLGGKNTNFTSTYASHPNENISDFTHAYIIYFVIYRMSHWLYEVSVSENVHSDTVPYNVVHFVILHIRPKWKKKDLKFVQTETFKICHKCYLDLVWDLVLCSLNSKQINKQKRFG